MTTSYPSTVPGGSVTGAKPGSTRLVDAFLMAWSTQPKDETTDPPPEGWGGEKQNDPDACAASLNAVADAWKMAYRPLWRIWSECKGMVYGDAYGSFSWSASATNYWTPRAPAPEKKVTRTTVPHMQSICADVAGIQCQDELALHASPPADTSSATAACEAADALIAWMWEVGGYDAKNFALREEAAVVGNSYLHIIWSAAEGSLVDKITGYEPVPGPADPTTGVPSGMALSPVTEKVREGNFADEIISCFEALPDPASTDEWDGEGFVIDRMMPIATMRGLYPAFADKFTRDNPTANDGALFADQAKGMSPKQPAGSYGTTIALQSERVRTLWIYLRTCGEFYRGRWAVVVHNTLVYLGDNPVYPTKEQEAAGARFPVAYHWPVLRFAHNTVSGSYFAQGVAVRLIDPQRKLNGIASKKLHMIKRTSHPVLVKPKRADFVKTDEPDQQINVAADIQPGSIYYLQSPVFPPELRQSERDCVEEMEEIAGLHAGSRGASLPNTSGTKDRQLFQRDLGRLERWKRHNDRQMCLAFNIKLQFFQRWSDVARTIKIVGDNLAPQVMSLAGADIAQGTEVVTYPDLMMPKDPQGRALHIEKAIQLKLVDPSDPTQRAGLARLLGFPGGTKQFEETLYADVRCALDENQDMYRGDDPKTEFWYDHAKHLATHYAEMDTARWRKECQVKPNDPPQIAAQKQAAYDRWIGHVQFHQQALAALKASEAAQAKPPSTSIAFKDLPPDGQEQLAAQAGIHLAPPKQPNGAPQSPGPGAAAPSQSSPMQAQGGPPAQRQAA